MCLHGVEAHNAWFSRAPKARRLEPFVRCPDNSIAAFGTQPEVTPLNVCSGITAMHQLRETLNLKTDTEPKC